MIYFSLRSSFKTESKKNSHIKPYHFLTMSLNPDAPAFVPPSCRKNLRYQQVPTDPDSLNVRAVPYFPVFKTPIPLSSPLPSSLPSPSPSLQQQQEPQQEPQPPSLQQQPPSLQQQDLEPPFSFPSDPKEFHAFFFSLFHEVGNFFNGDSVNFTGIPRTLMKEALEIYRFCETWKRDDPLPPVFTAFNTVSPTNRELVNATLYLHAALWIGTLEMRHFVIGIESSTRNSTRNNTLNTNNKPIIGRTPLMMEVILHSIVVDGPDIDSHELIAKKLKVLRFVFNKFPKTRLSAERDVEIVMKLEEMGFGF